MSAFPCLHRSGAREENKAMVLLRVIMTLTEAQEDYIEIGLGPVADMSDSAR